MKECEACTQWEQHSGLFIRDCRSCQARMLASLPSAWKAYERAYPYDLQHAMRLLWRDPEEYLEGRLLVHAWYTQIQGQP